MADMADKYLGEPHPDELRERAEGVLKKLDRRRTFSGALSTIAAVAGLLGLVTSISAALSDKIGFDVTGQRGVAETRTKLDDQMVRRIGQLQGDVTALQKAQAAIAQLPSGDRTAVQISALTARVDAIERRETRLEQAILNNPEKALAMPLMRRDIDNMRDSNSQNLLAIKQSVDQVYDLTKWLLGALAVGVFSLAIANFFTKK